MKADLGGEEEMLHFNLISKGTKRTWKMNEGDKLSVNNDNKTKSFGISQILPVISLTG
jgi:hypothetical protein